MATAWKSIQGGVTAPFGFLAAGISCGIKSTGKKDLSLLFSEAPASWGAVLTTNRAPAAPVVLTRELLRRRRPLQAVIVNSGNANASTGEGGRKSAREVIAALTGRCGLARGAVVMASTGIIGEPLPLVKITRALPLLVEGLSRRGGRAAAEGIMTTDSLPKEAALELKAGGKRIRIGGMAKGAGMIHPRMATMLSFVTTDAAVSSPLLSGILREAVEETFNRISVDGDCSTNDTVLVMANGAGGASVAPGSRTEGLFRRGLHEVCRRLAEKIVMDGEGATKMVEVRIQGARSRRDALLAARAVANSSLVKTAWYGQDLNWGRIVAALGYSGARIDVGKISLSVNGKAAVKGGESLPAPQLSRARREMRRRKLVFGIDLGLGTASEHMLTCDLSEEYVRENALYTT